jgi:hypothetical protein
MSIGGALQWGSQALTVLAGIWALFGETTAKDPQTGQRRLTALGYTKISLILVAFCLYVVTQSENARRARARPRRATQLHAQAQQLEFLRQLSCTNTVCLPSRSAGLWVPGLRSHRDRAARCR